MKIQFYSFVRFLSVLIISFVFSSNNYAQEGSPFITNYEIGTQYKFQNWAIVQDQNQIMFFANQKGILSFDGKTWEMILTHNMPLTMYTDTSDNRVYVGCVNDVGYIEKLSTGTFVYKSIKEDYSDIGKTIEITSIEDRLIVLADDFITIFDKKDYSVIKQIEYDNQKMPLNNIINYSNDVFMVTKKNRFFKVKDDTINSVRIKNKKNIGEILFEIPINKKQTVIGTTNNNLYFFGGRSVWRFKIKDQKYLDESILVDAIPLSDSKIAVSTLIGGILIIDTKTRKTVRTINHSSGLPDNEIFAIGKDADNGLWLSHSLGISRIDFSVPVKLYNTFHGLEGRLLSVINFKNSIFVGTGEGLFKLDELDEFKRAMMIESKIYSISKDLKAEKELRAKEDAKKKTVLTELQKKIKGKVSPDNTIKISENRRNSLIRKRKEMGMQSLSHAFKKFEGIDDRCKHLLVYDNKLIVGGNNGVYVVEEDEAAAEKIISDKYVNSITPDKVNPNLLYICTNNGVFLLEYIDDEWEKSSIEGLEEQVVFSVFADKNSLWAGTDNNVFLIDTAENNIKEYVINNKYAEPILIQEYKDETYFILPSKILYYCRVTDKIKTFTPKELSYFKSQSNALWIKEDEKWKTIIGPDDYNNENNIYFNLFSNPEYLYIDKKNNTWLIDDKNNLVKIKNFTDDLYASEQNIFIKRISNQEGEKYSLKNMFLEPDENFFQVSLSAPFYIKQGAIEYQYFLEGLMKEWSEWGSNPTFSFPYVPPGKYSLHVKARNILGNMSEEESISFSIKEPFWEEQWFLIGSGVFLLALVILVIRLRERKLQKKQSILEDKIQERTKTIAEQRNQIAKSHQSIKDSIVYAKRIQEAVMPSKELLDNSFDDYFVFFKPRDIVSGDFFWIKKIGDYTVYAVADCTGHGVPGALLSMLGISFLGEIVSKVRFDSAGDTLNRLRKKIKRSFKQTAKGLESKDGMDIALCVIDHESLQLQFAGAYNPVYIIRRGELTEIKATRNPIGAHIKERPFITNKVQLEKGDILYTFSDGFPDQFGQNDSQKFNKRNFKKLLIKISNKPLPEQKEILGSVLKKWKGSTEQTDDIIVMGVKV